MNYLMGLRKIRFHAYVGRLFVQAGIILSALAIAMFFLDIAKLATFTGKSQVAIQSNVGSNSESDMEDETEDGGQDSPTLVSFSSKYVPAPAFDFLADISHTISHSNQSPPDFPPEITFSLHS